MVDRDQAVIFFLLSQSVSFYDFLNENILLISVTVQNS